MDFGVPSVSSSSHCLSVPPVLVDPTRIGSVLSNLSHELCRQLAALQTGFDLILGESPSAIPQDQRGQLL